MGADLLAWTFYEKGTASTKVMMANSAFTWRQKIVTMTMEVFRRQRNSSRQLNMRSRARMMEKFIDKMRRSGYPQCTVRGVMESGLMYYYRKLKIDLQGGPAVNARVESNEMDRRRKKLGGAQSWFKNRRRGGEQERMKKDHSWRNEIGVKYWKNKHEKGVRKSGPARVEGGE